MKFPQRRQPAQVAPISLVGPGFRGLNTELTSVAADVDGQYALDLREVVFDQVGTISTRKGWTTVAGTPMTGAPSVSRVFEYLRADGTVSLVAATSGKFWASTDNGATWTDVTGSLTPTGTKWMFVNFNDKIIAAAPGFRPVVYTGSGNFTAITAGSGIVPISNGVILAAYGRLWVAEDATGAFVYSALLDETLWDTPDGGGSIDTSNVWTLGTDEITAARALGATMVVFGRRHVLLYVDGAGSSIGIDPDNMYVVDTIEQVGCIARDSVVAIGEGDLWFLGPGGIQSLTRIIADKTNPLVAVSRWQNSLVQALVANEADVRYDVQATFNATERFVLFRFPGSTRILMYDTRYPLDDGTARCAEWRDQAHTCVFSRLSGTLLFGRSNGTVATYGTYRDNSSGTPVAISGIYSSPWLDGGVQAAANLKLPKRVNFHIVGRETLTIVTRWGFDFRGLEFSNTQTNDFVASGSEWALGEFGEAEWSGGVRTRRAYTPLCGNGLNVKIWFSWTSTDVSDRSALKSLTLYTRIGRAG